LTVTCAAKKSNAAMRQKGSFLPLGGERD